MEEWATKIRAFFAKYIRNEEFGDDDDVFGSGLVNSLMAMQLVLFVEKEFGVSVDNDDLDLANFRSVNRVAEFVQRKKSA
jgi:methoxymalonate biosynthesis acyl carrier protein